jgi:ACS family tartrate transporter-like MFS transporter
MDEAMKRAVLTKVGWRLLPFLFLLYVVNILDRVNVSFARLRMLDDLDMSESVYALGFGLFYFGYLLFEVPSNLIMSRTGARRWIARIMISWGAITCATMAVKGPWGFYLLRILLGLAEAGFFPGIILYLTYWFPTRQRARVVAFFMAASPITGVLGNPLSGAIMKWLDQVGGLSGWQWVFLMEGLPAMLLGFIVLVYLTDRPEQAGWLAPDERNWLAAEIGREEKEREQRHGLTLWRAVSDRRVLLLIALYFTAASGSGAFGAYLPELLNDRFAALDTFQIGLLAAVPNICAVLVMVLHGAHSDRTGERRWHVAVPAFLAAAGWVSTAFVQSPILYVLALTLVQVGIMCMLPTFWTLPTALLSGTAAAGGIALINALGNLGGFAGPNLIGQFKQLTGSFAPGLVGVALTMCLGGILALCVRHDQPGTSRDRPGAIPAP